MGRPEVRRPTGDASNGRSIWLRGCVLRTSLLQGGLLSARRLVAAPKVQCRESSAACTLLLLSSRGRARRPRPKHLRLRTSRPFVVSVNSPCRLSRVGWQTYASGRLTYVRIALAWTAQSTAPTDCLPNAAHFGAVLFRAAGRCRALRDQSRGLERISADCHHARVTPNRAIICRTAVEPAPMSGV